MQHHSTPGETATKFKLQIEIQWLYSSTSVEWNNSKKERKIREQHVDENLNEEKLPEIQKESRENKRRGLVTYLEAGQPLISRPVKKGKKCTTPHALLKFQLLGNYPTKLNLI